MDDVAVLARSGVVFPFDIFLCTFFLCLESMQASDACIYVAMYEEPGSGGRRLRMSAC